MKEAANNKSKKIRIGIIIFLCLVIAFCLIMILFATEKYRVAGNLYTTTEEKVIPVKSGVPDYDYDALKKINPDAVGWIYSKDWMSYPIVQGEDNDYYLHHLIDGTWNDCGTLFVDYNDKKGLNGTYCTVYGHNMNDGSMFGNLDQLESEDFYKAHSSVDVYVGYKHYKYKIISAFTTPVDSFVFTAKYEKVKPSVFVKEARKQCLYETDEIEVNSKSHVMVLSTCTNNSDYAYRYVAILVRDDNASPDTEIKEVTKINEGDSTDATYTRTIGERLEAFWKAIKNFFMHTFGGAFNSGGE